MKTPCYAAVLSIFMGICGSASSQPVQWAESAGGNGHFYEVVMDNPGDFESAQLNANARSYDGSSGHLVTLTSAEENTWVRDTLIAPHALTAGTFFMGGWNDVFWSGSGWRWVTEEAWSYTNWGQGEPSGGESVLSFKYGVDTATNAWNDVDYSYPWALGFIVEYDGLPVTFRPLYDPYPPSLAQWPMAEGGNGHWYEIVLMEIADYADAQRLSRRVSHGRWPYSNPISDGFW